jgi:hypothetical protein
MKFDFLEKIEEKFVFKTSHLFFHFLVALAMLVFLASLALLLWGVSPTFKPGVEKVEYPLPVAVSVDEILAAITAIENRQRGYVAQIQAISRSDVTQQAQAQDKSNVSDPNKQSYGKALDSLKTLLPLEKHLWVDQGRWERDYYGNSHFVIERYGIESQLQATFNEANALNYIQKRDILRGYLNILKPIEEGSRHDLLQNLMLWTVESTEKTQEHMKLLSHAIKIYQPQFGLAVAKLVNFGKKNPRDGDSFVAYANEIIPKFNSAFKTEILDELMSCYYRYYDDISAQKEATDLFIPLLAKVEGKYQAPALRIFYQLFIDKNRERKRAIEQIDHEYASELSAAQMLVQEKQARKAWYRLRGLIGAGGSIMFISVIALTLIMLSIQRNIKQLRVEMQRT